MVYDGGAYEVTISIHAPRTGSDDARFHALAHVHISIHAPRTGSDKPCLLAQHQKADFNPRSPHGERPSRTHFCPLVVQFQSTLPARGATVSLHPSGKPHLFQSTLPARGATTAHLLEIRPFGISIHAPRTGSDPPRPTIAMPTKRFQSTLPARGATPAEGTNEAAEWHFNPRSPHGERRQTSQPQLGFRYFNPRSPHGERLVEFEDEFFY